jgi:UDP-glucose 4-epimerase
LFFSESDYDCHKSSAPLNAKQELEELVLAISQLKQSDFVNYRISNVFGAGLSHGFINESIENIRNGRPVRIFKNLDIIRDYLLIDDLIDAFFNLRLYNFSDNVFNISTGFGVAISEVIEHLELSWGKDLKFLEIEAPKHTLPRSVLSCKNLEKTIPWKPQLLGESLARVSKTQSLRITSLNSDERINNRNGWIDD